MSTSLKNHLHNCVITGIKIVPYPPFVEPDISYRISKTLYWSETFTSQPISLKNHKHGIVDLPSIGIDAQQLLSNSMANHGHEQEGADIGITGISISLVTFIPPPIS